LEIIWPQKTTMKPRLHRGVRHIAEKEGNQTETKLTLAAYQTGD
jgi:hypothetical protein